MTRSILIALCAALLAPVLVAAAPLAEKIHQAALAGLDPKNLRKDTTPHTLYGEAINTKDLAYGRYACARVVSAVLKEAGVRVPRLNDKGGETAGLAMAVYEVERKLQRLGWTAITNSAELRHGDVIVWRKTSNANKGYFCSGGGSCHVGIVTSKGYFNNHVWWGSPSFANVGSGFVFKIGYRSR